ncbi:hypothetical protein FSP39_005144 [Pinctada imbricata]|nr:hypothetical protein FSP39_003637 [Pinctada imbricata]KAK3101645.1 hypothetical protein FSP39_005144 [Pinctada imbricata]
MRTLRFYIFTKQKSLCEQDLPDLDVPQEQQVEGQCYSMEEGHSASLSSSDPSLGASDFQSSAPATSMISFLDSSESTFSLSQPASIIIQSSSNTNIDPVNSPQKSGGSENTNITDQTISSSSASESQNSNTLHIVRSPSLESVSFTPQDYTADHSAAQAGFSAFTRVIHIPVDEDMVFSYGTESLDLLPSEREEPSISVNDFNVPHRESMVSERDEIRLHQGNVFSELLSLFKCADMKLDAQMRRILPNGKEETAEGTGVLRDILTEFWETFYVKCCDGANIKIPILRHDMGECEWTSVARIFVEGYKILKFFPIQISPLFLEDCVYGFCPEGLITEFLEYIPESERRILRQAIDDIQTVASEDSLSDLIDILETHECRIFPTEANITAIIHEIAHKEIIQEPKFVSDCWSKIMQPEFLSISKEDFRKIVEVRRPSVKKVLTSLKVPETISPQQSVVAGHLKRFVKGLDNRNLEKFLRFCTGACFLTESINVEFTSSCTGLARRPTSRTCVNSLILPSLYESFADFKEEFLNVLESNVWDMDYI